MFGKRYVEGTDIELTSEEVEEIRRTNLFGQVPQYVSQDVYNRARQNIAERSATCKKTPKKKKRMRM